MVYHEIQTKRILMFLPWRIHKSRSLDNFLSLKYGSVKTVKFENTK